MRIDASSSSKDKNSYRWKIWETVTSRQLHIFTGRFTQNDNRFIIGADKLLFRWWCHGDTDTDLTHLQTRYTFLKYHHHVTLRSYVRSITNFVIAIQRR